MEPEHALREILKAFVVTGKGLEFAYPPGTTLSQLADRDFEGFMMPYLSPEKAADLAIVYRDNPRG